MKIAPLLIKRIPHVTATLTNKQYNDMYSKEINMNAIKAIMHNKVLHALITKQEFDYEKIVVDQFVYPQKYYDHLKNSKYIVRNISFTTKHLALSTYSGIPLNKIPRQSPILWPPDAKN